MQTVPTGTIDGRLVATLTAAIARASRWAGSREEDGLGNGDKEALSAFPYKKAIFDALDEIADALIAASVELEVSPPDLNEVASQLAKAQEARLRAFDAALRVWDEK